MRYLSVRGFCFVLALLFSSAVASAQFGEYTLGAGYSHIHTGTSPGLFYNKDGAYIDGDFAWHLPYPGSPFLLGFGLSGSGYWDNQNLDDLTGNDFFRNPTLNSDLENFEIEPRFTLDLTIPGTIVFIKPRIGAGLLINNYNIDQFFQQGNNFADINTATHTGAAFEIHPAVQTGIAWGPAAGLEVSYLASWGDFGARQPRPGTPRPGAFLSIRF